MRLCEHFHFTPDELDAIDPQTINDWLLILDYDAKIQESKMRKP